jgi:hypothetical protein
LPVQASRLHYEKEYQEAWATKNNAEMEVVLDDGARVDCITEEYAIEFDFANKWAEAIGQSLYYAHKTNKKPAVVLIMENPEQDEKYYNRIKQVAENYGITVFKMFTLED